LRQLGSLPILPEGPFACRGRSGRQLNHEHVNVGRPVCSAEKRVPFSRPWPLDEFPASVSSEHQRSSQPGRTAGTDISTYVLLHGVGLSHRSFSRLARVLSESGYVVAPDLPGFGQRARGTRSVVPLSVQQYAEHVVDLLIGMHAEARGSGPVVVVGHSMGVQFALETALRRPDLVDGLVFVGAVVDPRHCTLPAQALRLARDFLLEPPLTCVMALRDYARCGFGWYLAEAREMLAYPTHERIAEYDGPLLTLRGEHDPIAAPDWNESLAASVPASAVGHIPGGRHNVVHSDAVATAIRIRGFADALASRAAP
jgi:pimeloyl-ACP methyl ester carboxylesterase